MKHLIQNTATFRLHKTDYLSKFVFASVLSVKIITELDLFFHIYSSDFIYSICKNKAVLNWSHTE